MLGARSGDIQSAGLRASQALPHFLSLTQTFLKSWEGHPAKGADPGGASDHGQPGIWVGSLETGARPAGTDSL